MALCCFDSEMAGHAKPMMWWYEPLDPTMAMLPALDAHHGRPPVLDSHVDVSHWAIFGLNLSQPHLVTPGMRDALQRLTRVHYRDHLSAWQEALVPTHVMGQQYVGQYRNGDFLAPIDAITAGDPDKIHRGLLSA